MVIDGKAIAARIYRELRNEISHFTIKPHITVFTCAPNFETQKYLALKKRKATEVGIAMNVIEFPDSISTEELKLSIRQAAIQTDGIVLQLPFPQQIDITEVLTVIPPSLDVDVMHYTGMATEVLPPVVGAIKEIADHVDVLFATRSVVVVGNGRLVGAPAAAWAKSQGARVTTITESTPNKETLIKAANILILGAGKARLITPEMIAPGVVIFDAGTSEDSGELVGDADPRCAATAAVFTPVPGGIGPITVAVLLRNLITLAKANHGRS